MYYPIGWHKVLNLDTECDQERCSILSIQANHERELFFILTTRSIHIWNPKPSVEIVCHRRSKESIDDIGYNKLAVWRTNSRVIVVATDRDQLLFYNVRERTSTMSSTNLLLQKSNDSDGIYRLHHNSKNLKNIFNRDLNQKLLSSFLVDTDHIPALTVFSFGKLDLSSIGVSCLMSAEEELIIGARNGEIYGINWLGDVDDKFPWSIAKDIEKGKDYVTDLKFSSVLGGFAMTFYSGRAGFMPSKVYEDKLTNGTNETLNKESAPCISFLPNVTDAICIEINHKFRLVAIGLKSPRAIVCNLGQQNASLVVNHKLELSIDKVPFDNTELGPIKSMRYSPDSFALATCWEGGDFAIWSVFGSLLFCSQQWHLASHINMSIKSVRICCLAWGREGHNLWMSTIREGDPNGEKLNVNNLDNNSIGSETSNQTEEVITISLAHSNLSSNPHSTCSSDSIVLMSEDRIYIGPSAPHKDKFDHWIVIDLPQSYLSVNYPIRYASVDRECENLAIAGNQGFAIYSIELSKWKFSSKNFEDENFSVCGDLIWWKDYLVLSCLNLDSNSFEIRAFSNSNNLNRFETQIIRTEIIRMSIFENRLLVLYSDGTLGMFMLNPRMRPKFRKPKSNSILSRSNSIVSSPGGNSTIEELKSSPKSVRSDSITSFNYQIDKISAFKDIVLQISPIENLVISNLQANAFCISSIALTRLHFKNNRHDDSILLNACGKLFLLEREAPPDLISSSPSSDLSTTDINELFLDSEKSNELDIKVISAKRNSNSIHFAAASLKNAIETSALSNVTFKAVSVIATNVEQFWISPDISNATDMSYFRKSLWLSCGGSNNYLQVWLPLLNDKNEPPTDLYVPDRIMLPVRCDIYPLAIRSSAPGVAEPDDAIVLGAECDIMYKDGSLFNYFPYNTVKRQCRVYLHRILRELLLSQHLGYYARKIAESCQSLPYFAHCFELLLHEVLEEEATSPVPLPDPMLPQVVRFIKEFPVYLETVVHCARKSELSMWSYLFDERAVGNPRRLFQECLDKNKLDTAASCLIILQSLDRNIVSHRMVKELIKAAKEDPAYNYLIEDLENFLTRAEFDSMSLSGSGSPT